MNDDTTRSDRQPGCTQQQAVDGRSFTWCGWCSWCGRPRPSQTQR